MIPGQTLEVSDGTKIHLALLHRKDNLKIDGPVKSGKTSDWVRRCKKLLEAQRSHPEE
jgi:hypothetical protein